MNRKIVTFSLATAIGASGLLLPLNNSALAETLEEKKQDIQQKQSDVSTNLEKKETEAAGLQAEKSKLDEEIKSIDLQVSETSGKIREKKESIKETTKKIEDLKVEIDEVKKRISERNKLLEDRARSLQQGGGVVSYLEVVLGAQSFGDLVSRVSAVSTIVEADREILKAHEEDKATLETAETALITEKKNLEDSLKELESLEKKLSEQSKQKQELMKQVQAKYGDTIQDIQELEVEADFLAEQKKAIEQEQKRQKEAAEAAARAAAEEAKKQAEAAKQQAEEAKKVQEAQQSKQTTQSTESTESTQSSSSSSSSNNSSSSSNSSNSSNTSSAETPSEVSSSFIWPASGTVTSEFGMRVHPVTGQRKLHAGIDIANSSGTPIYAPASGTVIRSGVMSGYGNVVFITHNMNGQVYTTVYGHLEASLVSAGQTVSQGQQIALMGNTGISTGPHLHFEIHEGPWNGSSNAVNPRKYLR